MKTIHQENAIRCGKWMLGLAITLCLVSDNPSAVLAQRPAGAGIGPQGGAAMQRNAGSHNEGQHQRGIGNFHRDRDNNPPGFQGGRGTNWENPRGPQGGPGASPDRRLGVKDAEWLNRHPHARERADTNQDGTIDRLERKDARRERFDHFLENHPEIQENLDANDDGTVDREEWKEARIQKFKERLENNPEFQQKLDYNGDGSVDKQEMKYARKLWRHKHNDRDNNPPGQAGGRGTNWENVPVPMDGPGASPDLRAKPETRALGQESSQEASDE